MSHLFVTFVIQGGARAKFRPLHHSTTINVWERIGEKHLAQLVGEGACQPDIFTTLMRGSLTLAPIMKGGSSAS